MLWCTLLIFEYCFFFFKQKTAYEMRISDWSSDVCSSDLPRGENLFHACAPAAAASVRKDRNCCRTTDMSWCAAANSCAVRDRRVRKVASVRISRDRKSVV